MAINSNVPREKTSIGTLSAQTLLTCTEGLVAVTTDDGAGDDYFPLAEGSSIVLSSALTVHVWNVAPPGETSKLHFMPV